MENNYYDQSLNAVKLYQVYQTKIDRVEQFLSAEIKFVREQLNQNEHILELGAGYGRIMKELAPAVASITGIDISQGSVEFGREYLKGCPNCVLEVMDVHQLAFDRPFDVVLCLQNGLSAIKGDALSVVQQSINLLTDHGRAFFSSYSPKFWSHRLAWFQEQGEKGLLGEIDVEQSKDGKIICKDGFVATTFTPDDLAKLGHASGHPYRIVEVDESSNFLIIEK